MPFCLFHNKKAYTIVGLCSFKLSDFEKPKFESLACFQPLNVIVIRNDKKKIACFFFFFVRKEHLLSKLLKV